MEVLSDGLTGLSLSVYYSNMTRNNLPTAAFTDLFIQSRTNGDNFLFFFSFSTDEHITFYVDRHLVHCNFGFY